MPTAARASLRRNSDLPQRAGNLELFYDLVFVFAITQISHFLLEHLTWTGVAQAALVLLVVWWSWNYTTWATNELDPDSVTVRCLLLGIMLLSLLMAIAIPDAFGEKALLFAGCYVAIQLARTGFLAFVASDAGTIERTRSARLVLWFVAAGVLWIAGALVDGPARTVLWLLALAIDYGGPLVVFHVPGLRRLPADAWSVGTEHFAERFQLFVIIALGETIVVTGATTAELELDFTTVLAFAIAFLGTAAIWWLYFNLVAAVVEKRLHAAQDRTRMARDAYTYLHVVIVAAVLISAVGDELVIAHPTEALHGAELLAVVAGPVTYLLAHVLLRLRVRGDISSRRLSAAVVCVGIGFAGGSLPAVVLSALLVGVLVAVIALDHRDRILAARRGEPSALDRVAHAATGPRAGSGAGPT